MLIVIAWELFASFVTQGRPSLAYDTFRDVAYAQGIARGEMGIDPLLDGFPAWYPPGAPAFFAVLSRLTSRGVPELYASSWLWFGWISPVLMFLLVRRGWGRSAAWLALPFVLLGSRWWLLHAAHPMASVQSFVLVFGALLAWQAARTARWPAAILAGALAGAVFWCHLLCAALVTGAFVLHGLLLRAWRTPTGEECGERKALALQSLAAGAIAGVVGAWPLVAQFTLQRVNEAPTHWFAPELHDARFALQSGAPLALVLGIFGLVTCARRWVSEGWLVAWFGLALGGSLVGYAAHDLGWPLPWALPHEFQWHQQLALMIAAAVGTVRLARRLVRSSQARAALATAVTAVSVGPALTSLRDTGSYLLSIDAGWHTIIQTADWLQRSSPPGSVIAGGPDVSYFVASLSGRRTFSLPAGHLNPAADPVRRASDAALLESTGVESTFVRLARQYSVGYLLSTNDDPESSRRRWNYTTWQTLRPVRSEDSTLVIFQVRAAPGR